MEKNYELSKEDKILEYILSSKYSKITVKQLAVIFGVNNEQKKYLEKIVANLCKQGYIYFDDSKRICVVDFKNYVVCKYCTKSKSFGFGIPIVPEKFNLQMEDIYIDVKERKVNCFDDDIVLVRITKEKNGIKSAEGYVEQVIEHQNKPIVAVIEMSEGFAFARPLVKGIEDIYIPAHAFAHGLKDNDTAVVSIVKQATKQKKAQGKIERIISKSNMLEYDRQVILAMHSLDERFKTPVINEAKEVASLNIETEKKSRVDYTGQEYKIFTIDSLSAKDLDDAVEVKKNNDNTYTLYVHIADVSHYVKEGGELDKESIKRGTSIYIPSFVIKMLPEQLSNGACSLNPDEDKLTMTVQCKIDAKGNVVDTTVEKSVIRSKCRMNYDDVEKVLRGDKKIYSEYTQEILLMGELAKILREKREKNGSINFDIPESDIELNSDGSVESIKPYEIHESNQIIEEFMLLANYEIAKMFKQLSAPFIYRIHEKPDMDTIESLKEMLTVFNISMKCPKQIHPKVLADLVSSEMLDERQRDIVAKLVLRSLKLAKYSNECVGHFGLNFKYYTHFTSPIRRYPDLFIHRVISSYIDNNYCLDDNTYQKYLKQAKNYAESSSDCEKIATKVERDACDLYKAKYMESKIGEEYDAVISSVTNFGIYAKLDNTVEGMIPLSLLDDYYVFDDKYLRLVAQGKNKMYEIGQKVRVRVLKASSYTRQIDFEIVK